MKTIMGTVIFILMYLLIKSFEVSFWVIQILGMMVLFVGLVIVMVQDTSAFCKNKANSRYHFLNWKGKSYIGMCITALCTYLLTTDVDKNIFGAIGIALLIAGWIVLAGYDICVSQDDGNNSRKSYEQLDEVESNLKREYEEKMKDIL